MSRAAYLITTPARDVQLLKFLLLCDTMKDRYGEPERGE
jgi:hypothetical protein